MAQLTKKVTPAVPAQEHVVHEKYTGYYTAYADFDFPDGRKWRHVSEGAVFTAPVDWLEIPNRDPSIKGLTFSYPEIIKSDDKEEETAKYLVLPLVKS